MTEIKQAVIVAFVGKTQDRFSEYQKPATTKDKLEVVSRIEGFTGAEMVFPYETGYPLETIGEAFDYLPEIPLFIEPKYSETRVHYQLDSTAKALVLQKEVGNPNTGITLDMGHSLQSQENPAQALSLIYESGFDAYIHTNDNDAKADWDLIGASRHFLHYVEPMFWAREYGYSKFFTTGASPSIFDIVEFFNRHSEITIGVYNLAKSLNREKIQEMMQSEDFNGLMKMVNK